MTSAPVSHQTAEGLVKLVLIALGIQIVIVGYVFYQSWEGRTNIAISQRVGCERGKLDNSDNAAFQRAQTEYINRVVLAQSVKEDVKRAARVAVKTFGRTSSALTTRSKIDCNKLYPNPRIFP